MFAFNPGNDDRSGEIIGQGAVNAANTTANPAANPAPALSKTGTFWRAP